MKKLSRILVFQHATAEHPGSFRKYFQKDNIEWCPIVLNEGEQIPSLEGFDALWVMGGPMDVWEEAKYPWLQQEKAAIREAVLDRSMPYLGFCLGHQLLSDALGGEVGKAEQSEIGIFDIHKTPTGLESSFLNGLPNTFKCLQWHSAEVKRVPNNAKVLASSNACESQAISFGSNAYSIQFHIEATQATITEWCEIPELKLSLESKFGENAIEEMRNETNKHLNEINLYSRFLYENWKQSI
ncbi:MAG: type 1 glutamine amidotransferase [Gammaproteobacteria bacterium]|nr:type 1 glutamine amidotransferase [Gammaproteobacteria bacterium]